MQCTRNSGCFPRGKRSAIVRRYTFFVSFFLCAVFSCFRNPRNSDMDYRIFNVRTSSLLCMRIHTGGWGTPHRQRVSTTFFDSEKPSDFSCAPDGVGTSGHRWNLLDLEADAVPIRSHRVHGDAHTLYACPKHWDLAARSVKRACPARQQPVSSTCMRPEAEAARRKPLAA